MAPGQNLLAAQPSARSLPDVDGEETPLKDFCSQHYAFLFFFFNVYLLWLHWSYLWHLGSSSQTRVRTSAPCSGGMVSLPLDRQVSPTNSALRTKRLEQVVKRNQVKPKEAQGPLSFP